MEVETLHSYRKFTDEEIKFCKNLYSVQDRKLHAIYSAYIRTADRDDFIHTIKRYYE
jgi:hypothetical protein